MKNEKGVFLISSFLVLSVIGTFSLALFLKETTLYRSAERTVNRITAFHLAESGVDQAIVQLRNNLSYGGQGYANLGNKGGFDIQVEAPDLTQPNLRRITARGHVPNNIITAYAYAMRQVVAYVNFTPSTSPYAFFSNSSIQMSGNAGTDSYDSRNGLYHLQTPGQNGHMGTNSTAAHNVMLSGNVRIGGNAIVGPGGNPSNVIVMSGNARIDGTRTAASARRVLDPVQIPTDLTHQGALNVSGNSAMTLPGGNYWYSSINITGNGKVEFTGPATVYVTGRVSISGNGFGTAQNLPPNLTIKTQGQASGVPGGGQVTLSGNANFYGSIYAPASDVIISGNGNLYGTVTGNTLQDSGNGKIHYDEALNPESGGSTSTSSLLAWTEV